MHLHVPFHSHLAHALPTQERVEERDRKRVYWDHAMHVLLAMIPFHLEFSCIEAHTSRAYEDEEVIASMQVVHVISLL